jgi:hypothetical protein
MIFQTAGREFRRKVDETRATIFDSTYIWGTDR